MELQLIMLNEKSQAQKVKYSIFYSFVESGPTMTMMMMMMMMMIMGHECKRGTP
jgi:hypothetical protein